jgi:phytoene/squalene synthetase
MTDTGEPSDYCTGELRDHDPERYVTSLFAADEDRAALHALYAFNLELARIATMVTEPLLGQVRLQWWREAIEGIYEGTPRHHEVVLALASAIRDRDLPRATFETMISGREIELEAEPPETMADLEAYLRATAGELVAVSLRAAGVEEGSPLLDAGPEVGIAAGYLTVLRALKSESGRLHPLLPKDLLARHGVTVDEIAAGRASSGLANAAREIGDKTIGHVETARKQIGRPIRRHMAPLLAAALVPSYLQALKAAGYDPFAANYERGSLGRHLRLYKSAFLRRI